MAVALYGGGAMPMRVACGCRRRGIQAGCAGGEFFKSGSRDLSFTTNRTVTMVVRGVRLHPPAPPWIY